MKRNMITYPVSIGPGLYALAKRRLDKFDREWLAICERQRTCTHEKRDPRGTCYHCGNPKEAI
jgi:hypothetical protein